jgi:hypothetical protein
MRVQFHKWLFDKGSKIRRSLDVLFDESETFNDNPSYRLQIIISIWKDKFL